jgi:cardiolipin synthase
MTLANRITLIRLLLTPVVIIALMTQGPSVWAISIFLVAALTDALDGFVARRRGQLTTLGRFLDPIADKLLLSATFLALAHRGLVPMWVFIIVFSRDLLILIGWNVIYILTKTFTVEPRWLGKLSTFSQMAAVVIILAFHDAALGRAVAGLMIVFTSLSTIDYVWVGARKLGELG